MNKIKNPADDPTFPNPEPGLGWPWTFKHAPDISYPDDWPTISIITPNFNNAKFLEETIRSVLLQAYPKLEYIIIDGGSTDGSVEIIKKYEPWISQWVSEKDEGQSHAINKGYNMATGDWLAFLNSDDIYYPFALIEVARFLQKHPKTEWIAADPRVFDDAGNELNIKKPDLADLDRPEKWLTYEVHIPQHSSFIHKCCLDKYSDLDERFQYVFDLEYFMRLGAAHLTPVYLPEVIAGFRIHTTSKTSESRLPFLQEQEQLIDHYAPLMDSETVAATRQKLSAMIADYFVYESNEVATGPGGYHKAFQYLNAAVAKDWRVVKKRAFWGALKNLMF